jgi:hypothetical protein
LFLVAPFLLLLLPFLSSWLINMTSIYYGTLVHSVSLSDLEIITNGVLVVDNDKGVIVHVEKDVKDLDAFLASKSYENIEVGNTRKKAL